MNKFFIISVFNDLPVKLQKNIEWEKSLSCIFCISNLIYVYNPVMNFINLLKKSEIMWSKLPLIFYCQNRLGKMWIFNGSLKFFVYFSAAKLPKKMQYGPRMSPSPDGSSVILTYLKDIYKLNCKSGLQCTWELLPNKLQVSRQYHIQVTVPAVQNCWKIYMFECTYTPDFLCTHS